MDNRWTLAQCKTIIDTYKDFYADDRLDVIVYNPILRNYLTKEDSSEEDPPEDILSDNILAFECTTYHPEITITNERGNTHTITDVYVNVSFPHLKIALGRASYTPEEVTVGYIHSHVHSGNFFDYMNDFCTGNNDTPINVIKRHIKNFNAKKDDLSTLISSFIIEVERMIRVESIEGGPYIKMSSIRKGVGKQPIFLHTKNIISLSINRCIRVGYKKDIQNFILYYASLRLDSFYYDGQNWQLSGSDAEFISRVTKVAKAYKGIKTKSSLFTNALYADGLYYDNSRATVYHLHPNTYSSWKFKNQVIKITLKDSSENKGMESCKILNPSIIEVVYNFLLNLINSVYVNNRYKDSLHSRAYKVTRTLVKQL